MYNIKPPLNRFRSCLHCLNPAIWNWFNRNVQSNFHSKIRKISKALIIFLAETNLLLIELIFRLPIIVFKALSILCLQICRMLLFIEKHDSEFSEEAKGSVKAHQSFGSIGSSLSTGFQVYLSKCWDPYVRPSCTIRLVFFSGLSVLFQDLDLVTASHRAGLQVYLS